MLRMMVMALLVAMFPSVAWAQAAEAATTTNTLRAAPGAAGPAASVADMKWLIGRWKGTGLGGVSEEIWAEPVGGVMMGMFRLVQKGQPSFYEFMHLAEEKGSLVMKIKHFNPDLTAWEEKDRFLTFPLVKMGRNEAFFGGLTFRLVSERRLDIYLAMRQDGKVREERFELERQD